MICKTFEVRDEGTFVPVLAVRLDPECEGDRRLFARAGFGVTPEGQARFVLLIDLNTHEHQYDPMAWGGRTMPAAHRYVEERFMSLRSGDVVDARCALGETDESAESEAHLYG